MGLDELCDDTLINIFQRLSAKDLSSVAQVNKRFRKMIYLPALWNNKKTNVVFDERNQKELILLRSTDMRKVRIFPLDGPSKFSANKLFREQRYSNVTSLRLYAYHEDIDHETAQTIVKHMPNIIELRVMGKITRLAIEIFVIKLKKLKILNLHGCHNVSSVSLLAIKTHGINIEVLNVLGSYISSKGIKRLCAFQPGL